MSNNTIVSETGGDIELGLNVTLEQQFELEQEMMDGGIERFKRENDKALSSSKESRTLHGRTIIANALASVVVGVDEIKAGTSNRDIARKKLMDVPSDVAAYLAMTTAVDNLSKRSPLINTAGKIGSAIEIQDRLHKWVKREGKSALRVIDLANDKGETARAVGLIHKMNKDGHSDLAWKKEEKLHVGLRLIDAIIVHTGLVKVTMVQVSKNKKQSILEQTEKTFEWIKAFNEIAQCWRPRYMPCLIEPKDWTDITGGGYHSPVIEPLLIVRHK